MGLDVDNYFKADFNLVKRIKLQRGESERLRAIRRLIGPQAVYPRLLRASLQSSLMRTSAPGLPLEEILAE